MKAGIFVLLSCFLLLFFLDASNGILAQDDDGASELQPKQVFAKIPGLYDDVLAKMKKREISMTKILVAIPKGDFDTIKSEGEKINNEYSIEYDMDPDIQIDYNSMITSEFVFMDQDLVQYSSALASSAEEKYLEGVLIHFDQVMRSCVNCHYTFAKEKFPSLARSSVEE